MDLLSLVSATFYCKSNSSIPEVPFIIITNSSKTHTRKLQSQLLHTDFKIHAPIHKCVNRMSNLKHSIHLRHYILWNIVMAYQLQLSRWKGVITNYRLLGCDTLQFGRHLKNSLLSCRQRQRVPWNITKFLTSQKMAMSTITTWHTSLNFLYKKNGLKRGTFMLLSTDTITTMVLNL
jgi:hypothetical protein